MPEITVCEVHPAGRHAPASMETQDHHVVPRAWQQLWQPATAPFPGVWKEYGVSQRLWDARTIKVPPTCHRNVHARLVLVMRQLAVTWAPVVAGAPAHAFTTADVAAAGKALKVRDRMGGQELQWALEAPLRFLAAGGDLGVLIQAKAWGTA